MKMKTDLPILFKPEMVRAILTCASCGKISVPFPCEHCGSELFVKTQTRRVMAVQPPYESCRLSTCISTTGDKKKEGKHHWVTISDDGLEYLYDGDEYFANPYGGSAYNLWVRETFRPVQDPELWTCIEYRADGFRMKPTTWTHQQGFEAEVKAGEEFNQPGHWKPSIFMPRWASRILLDVEVVWWQRIQNISIDAAIAEGAPDTCPREMVLPDWFIPLWNSINAKTRPVYRKDETGKRVIDHYVSYPWDGDKRIEQHRGKNHLIMPNPAVWVVHFKRRSPVHA